MGRDQGRTSSGLIASRRQTGDDEQLYRETPRNGPDAAGGRWRMAAGKAVDSEHPKVLAERLLKREGEKEGGGRNGVWMHGGQRTRYSGYMKYFTRAEGSSLRAPSSRAVELRPGLIVANGAEPGKGLRHTEHFHAPNHTRNAPIGTRMELAAVIGTVQRDFHQHYPTSHPSCARRPGVQLAACEAKSRVAWHLANPMTLSIQRCNPASGQEISSCSTDTFRSQTIHISLLFHAQVEHRVSARKLRSPSALLPPPPQLPFLPSLEPPSQSSLLDKMCFVATRTPSVYPGTNIHDSDFQGRGPSLPPMCLTCEMMKESYHVSCATPKPHASDLCSAPKIASLLNLNSILHRLLPRHQAKSSFHSNNSV
ncbi:uncharacterized protein BDR25DRAFT_361837 [Lindgomyces ingoldianus]|uniref:Uncharacterized protein n=1 Tax=Lindgomyces ingoldianus TaxID=673940 RepID=A0ACB6QBV5_9PLEO|nr:uncharacterized protein BDR25DRAFT_361837 [Lindgomyces ingoldianus]KAF2464340.1 hypothetical protein BDR25DRAFT_361837 [Lindgomyces ingoldianus]